MRKEGLRTLLRIVRGGVVFLFLFALLACGEDTGLGASVDTEAPKLAITYPPSSAVIREDFVFAGTCSDDKGVSSVVATIKNVDTGLTFEEKATVTGNNWSVALNKKKGEGLNDWGLIEYEYPDGKYEISVVAYDGVGHTSGTNTRTVEIDNTPPIFFITSPQIDDLSDMTNYGTRFKIVGTIADEHKVKSMKVVVYDKDGNVVADSETNPITVNNVTTAGGTSETVASYLNMETTGNKLNDNYIAIYFADNPDRTGTVEYKCTVTLTDEAQVYRGQDADSAERSAIETETAGAGNSSSNLYAYYNIRDLVGADVFDANTMMQIINGTYNGEDAYFLKGVLKKSGNCQTEARFTLNPKANPTYRVTGFAVDSAESNPAEVWSETTGTAKISVVAQQGLNQTLIVKDSARTYLVGPFESENSIVSFIAKNKVLVDALYLDMEDLSDKYFENSKSNSPVDDKIFFEEYKSKWTNETVIIKDESVQNPITYFEKLEIDGVATGSGESYTYAYKIPEDGFVAGSSYLVLVTGWDKDGLAFSNGDNYYGFKFTVNSNKPQFKGVTFIKNNEDATPVSASGYSNLADMKITGKATTDSGTIESIEYTITVTDEASFEDAKSIFDGNGKRTFDKTKATVDFSFDLIDSKTLDLWSKKEIRYLYAVSLRVIDNNGENFETQYLLHVDTIKPVITFTSAKPTYEDTANNKVWTGKTGLTKLSGNIEESNIEKFIYKILKNGIDEVASGEVSGKYAFDFDGEKLKPSGDFTDGDYIVVVIEATDKAGNVGEAESPAYYVDVISPAIVTADKGDEYDGTKPGEIRIGVGADMRKYEQPKEDGTKTWLPSDALTFEGWYTENESGLNVVYYYLDTTNSASVGDAGYVKTNASGTMSATGGKFNSVISGFNPSGESTIYLVAEDNVGNLSNQSNYKIYVDKVGPVFEDIPEKDRNKPANGTSDVILEFTVTDAASGVDERRIEVFAVSNGTVYKLSGEDGCRLDEGSSTFGENGVFNGVYTITKEYIKAERHVPKAEGGKETGAFNGDVTIQIVVYDKAGNSTDNQQYKLQVDGSAPTVKVTAPKAPSVASPAVDDVSWITGITTIQGTISDVGVAGVNGKVGKFCYMIPTKDQQAAIIKGHTAAERVKELENASNWIKFDAEVETNWEIAFESSYLESATGKAGTPTAGKKSFVHYGYATENGKLKYATEFGTTDEEKAQFRTVPVYFLVEDLAGNKDVITDNIFYVDILSGKPKISVNYPKDGSDGKWQKLSESVEILGSARDNEVVSKITLEKVEYATADASEVFDKKDTGSLWTTLKKENAKIDEVDGYAHEVAASDNFGIVQKITNGDQVEMFDFKFDLSPLAEELKKSSAKVTAIRLTVAAEDDNGYPTSATQYAFIDTENPALESQKIVRLRDDDTLSTDAVTEIKEIRDGKVWVSETESHEILVERNYEPNMWLSGLKNDRNVGAHWFYIATVTDDSVVDGIELKGTNFSRAKQTPATTTTSYTFAIPIPVDKGNLSSNLYLYDGAHQDVFKSISLQIDNTAPQMRTVKSDTTKEGFAKEIADGKLKLVADGDLGETYVIENSNGSFSMGDQVKEGESGLAFVSFWIEREDKNSVYNPVHKMSADTFRFLDSTNSYDHHEYLSEPENKKVYINSEHLPALYVEGVTVGAADSKTTVTYSGFSDNKFFDRPGIMVKINGGYYRVESINGSTATLDSDLGLKGSTATVEFICAGIVDHIGVETLVDNTDTTYKVEGDDDDGIAETLRAKGDTYTWAAVFDSQNMADGPARVHVVAFDAAGNSSHAYVDTSIQNNRPRVAKLFVATDLDGTAGDTEKTFEFDEAVYKEYNSDYKQVFGDKKYSGDSFDARKNKYAYTAPIDEIDGVEMGEFVFYSTLDKNADASSFAVLTDKGVNGNFIAKEAVLILPEIVGGNRTNGGLKYTYEAKEASDNVSKFAPTAPAQSELYEFVTFSNGSANVGSNTTIKINNTTVLPQQGIYLSQKTLERYESWDSSGKKSRYMSFTIWDTTGVDGSKTSLTQGKNTLWSLFAIPMVINVVDDDAPVPVFETMYWNSKEDSSTVYDENDQPLGHIDTEADLRATGSNVEKPEVAGEIYLRGSVTDSSLVEEIYIIEPNGQEILVAKYNSGKWHSAYRDGSKYVSTCYDAETGEMVEDTSSDKFTPDWPKEGWKSFEITGERKPSQKDHKVDFRFRVDTTKFGVGSGDFKVVASDRGENKSSSDEKQQTKDGALTSCYKMDFVPYIRTITLGDGTEVNRSRLGRYPVRAGEEIRIYGMNFKAGETATVNFYKSKSENGIGNSTGVGDKKEYETGIVKTDENGNYVQVNATKYSRYVEVEVQNVRTKNNRNSNTKGNNIEEGYVASKKSAPTLADIGLTKASQNGTNFWTDDRYISVWNVETNFPGSINPHSGVIKKVRKEDTWKNGGTIGINKSGSDMSNSEDYAINMNDSFFGFISSDDMRVYQYSQKSDGTINQRYTMQNNNLATFTAPVDAVDCVIVGGLPYYVVQTNYVGNTAAERWGLGLILSREGFNYTKDAFETSKTLSETQYPFTIERQGNEQSAVARDSSTGYDAVLYQFKNFRMAGWHNSDPKTAEKCQYSNSGGNNLRDEVDYIYVSYYDSFAKCLKYAAYRSGRGTVNDVISPVAHPGEWGGGNTGDREVVPEVSGYGNMTNGATVVAGYDYAQKGTPSSFEEKAGEWSDIVLDTNTKDDRPIPVIVYYNETKKSLEIARGNSTFPKSKGKESNGGKLTGEDVWIKTKAVRPKGVTGDFGRYVSAAIDTSGNLHVAAQDVKNARLYYLYLTLSGDTYTVEKSVAVDASSGAGVWTDIELTDPSGDSIEMCKPVISYINNNYLKTTDGMKVAYLDRVAEDGTPVFEAMTDPAKWQVGDQRTSVLPDVKETKNNSTPKAIVGVGFNSDMLALDFLRGEGE